MLKLLNKVFNYENGNFSHTKFWSNIGYATGTFVIFHLLYLQALTPEYFGVYLSICAAHATASKYLNLRIEIPDKSAD